ncbi:MAG: class I SAM-dependent methyltransferase, partial [Bdellovibrionales bacterium]|nr:class I SAM-dependent methyltransferase [Bdellovibrionales bacterium]
MRLLNRLSNNRDERSLASQLRRRRFRFFRSLFDPLPRPLRLLDVGGTRLFWQQMGFADEAGVEIVLLNHQAGELALRERDIGATHFVEHIGDARAMPEFGDHSFDVVFSNSVLEHVGTFEDQQRMMAEVRRVGKRYFVQTPNYYFPLEPHFLVPGFQFLPLEAKIWLL